MGSQALYYIEMVNTLKKHIFVLDDEPKVRQVINETLEESNYKVSCFGDPVECLAGLRSKKCDLLITDLKMPEKDGFEVLVDVQHLAPMMPVLLMTGYSDIPTLVKAIRAGFVDFIEKPLSKNDILRKIKGILMNENNTNREEKVEHADAETENLLDDMSDRLNDAADGVAELTDGAEELSCEIKSLLDDLRAVQSKTGEEKKDKLESLIDRLEVVSKELQNTMWVMCLASADLQENIDP